MWRQLIFHNEHLKQGVKRSLASGLVRINADSGLIEISPNAYSMSFDANWIFFGHNTASARDCFTWHTIMFNCFNHFVPEFCKLRCYKVVVKVRTFLEAMQFRSAILASPYHYDDLVPLQGKVGKDERDYTDSPYNGFIYCDGLDDALEKYHHVRRIVTEQMDNGHEINVIIKRSCTEFERKHGPTDQPFWQSITKSEQDIERHLNDIYVGFKGSSVQPDWLVNSLIDGLVRWANMIGDHSWRNYFSEAPDWLTMSAVTYHPEAAKAPKDLVISKKTQQKSPPKKRRKSRAKKKS